MDPQFDWHTQNIDLAAALGAMLFPIRVGVKQDASSGRVLTMFEVGATSAQGDHSRDFILGAMKDDRLEVENVFHPLLCGLRALHNYKLLLSSQNTGQHLRLVGVAGGFATEYREGQELPEMVNSKAIYQTADLALTAALGTLGLPVIRIGDAGGGRRLYSIPALGHALHFRGEIIRHETIKLADRSAPGSYDLRLETTDPLHPMVLAYNATAVRSQLKKALQDEGRVIVHRHPKAPNRTMAITTENPAENVKKLLRNHMA